MERDNALAAISAQTSQAMTYRELSTTLSEKLEVAAVYFSSLPSKFHFRVGGDLCGLELSRKNSQEWELTYDWVSDGEFSRYSVVNAPIDVKIEAAKLLPEFFSGFHEELLRRNKALSEAVACLDQIPELQGSIEFSRYEDHGGR